MKTDDLWKVIDWLEIIINVAPLRIEFHSMIWFIIVLSKRRLYLFTQISKITRGSCIVLIGLVEFWQKIKEKMEFLQNFGSAVLVYATVYVKIYYCIILLYF